MSSKTNEENTKGQDTIDIFRPILEKTGNGKIIYGDGFENDVKFSFKFNQNGHTIGELELQNIKNPADLLKHFEGFNLFRAEGKTDDGENIVAHQCFITRRTENWGDGFSVKAEISAGKMKFPDGGMSEKSEGISAQFWITNMHKTFRVILPSEMGQLSIGHFKDMDGLEMLMKQYEISLITAVVHLEIPREKVTTVKETMEKAKHLVENFLKITRLAQVSWHSIVAVAAYDKIKDEQCPRIFFETFNAKTKKPSVFGLTNEAHFHYFMESAWKGYSEKTDEKYGFSYALEWFIDSWASSILETKFLCATTSLELLMEKFHTENGTELLLPDDKFSKFREEAKEKMSEILKSMDVENGTRALMYNGLNAMQRRSFLDKSRMLLEHWKIKYDDVGTTLEEIIRVRNNITHRGRFEAPDDGSGNDFLLGVYKGLFVILTRIFLAMLNYDRDYWDFVKGNFVKMEEVRIK